MSVNIETVVSRVLLFAIVFLALGSVNVMGAPAVIEDSVITANVKSKMLADKDVSGLSVHVETKNAIVELSGHVKTEEEASKAIEIAAATEGVRDVDATNLKVDASSQPFTDAAITAKVKGIYLRDKIFGEAPVAVSTVHVKTKDGVVYLTGSVENEAQLTNAEELAKTVKGVKSVKSTLMVKADK